MTHSQSGTRLRSFASLATSTLALLQLVGLPIATAFDITSNSNLVVYWGQNSYADSHTNDPSRWQQPLNFYCNDNTVDMIPIAYLDNFDSTGGLPSFNVSNSCTGPYFPDTSLLNCDFMASQIQACQAAGKAITLSLGGPLSSPNLKDNAQGQQFAQTIWDLFLGGQSNTRPFGDAILDGIDLAIEGGTPTGLVAFLSTLRELMDASNKKYYITASPGCEYPNPWMGTILNEFGFDAVFVHCYDNWCGLQGYDDLLAGNFGAWDQWAKDNSPNTDVKVYMGASASSTATSSGYVDATKLATILKQTKSKYNSFGGAMLWDMSQAYANNRYDVAAKKALTGQ